MHIETVFGIDLGVHSTKVSFSPPGQPGTILTKEFPNVILFLEGKEKYFGEEALKKITESPELHASSFVTNFASLVKLMCRKVASESESYHTFCAAKATVDHRVALIVKRDGTAVSPEKCLSYFLSFARQHILKNFFSSIPNVTAKAVVAIDDRFNFFSTSLLTQAFVKAGYSKPDIILGSLAVALLYNKLHNYLSSKNLLILDVGYSATRLSLVRVTPTEHELLDSAELNLGLRDCDMEVYINVISELKTKYRIDYQKDKFVRFDFLRKMHQARKTFGLAAGVVINLAETFGMRYFDQFFRIDAKRYQSLNKEHFERFQQFVNKCHERWCMERDILIDDFQALGGGAKVSKFVSIVERKFEARSLSDKLSCSYSRSYGAFLAATINEGLVYRLPQDLRWKVYELKQEQVNSERGVESSTEGQQGNAVGVENASADGGEKKQQAAGGQGPDDKPIATSELVPKFDEELHQQKSHLVSALDHMHRSHGKQVGLVATGLIYASKDAVSYQKNERSIELGTLEREKRYQLVIVSEGHDENLPARTLFKQELPFSDVTALTFEIDRSLTIKPLIFAPGNRRFEFTLYEERPIDASRLSFHESIIARRSDRVEAAPFAISLRDKSKCSCSHTAETKDSKLKKNGLMNAAFLHVVTDLFQDVIMLLVGVILYFRPNWEIIDPIFTIVTMTIMMGVIGQFTYRLYVRLMETVPNGVQFQAILSDLLKLQGVVEIHDLHVWEVGNQKRVATAHIVTNEHKDQVLKEATVVFRKHLIYHSTVQVESVAGKNDEFYVSCQNDIEHAPA